MSKAGRIGAILILALGLLDLTAIIFASQRSRAEPVRLERAAEPPRDAEAPVCLDDWIRPPRT